MGILYSKANKLPGVKREIIKKVLSIIYKLWNAPACSTCKNRAPHLYFTSAPSKAFFTSCIHYGKTRHFRQQSANPFYEIANITKCKLKQQAMEIHNLLDIKSRTGLREWLIQNHKIYFIKKCCEIEVYQATLREHVEIHNSHDVKIYRIFLG